MSRKKRSDAKTRVNPPLDSHTHALLCRLALACNKSKTSLAAEIIEIALRTPEFVQFVQEQNKADEFRIRLIVVEGKTSYMDA